MSKILLMSAIVTLLFCLGLPAFADPDLDEEIAAQQQASYELERRIQQYNVTAGRTSRQARVLQERLIELQRDSNMAQQHIELLESQLDRLQRSISALDTEMGEISFQMDVLINELRLRVINVHKYGSREELNLLLSAESAHEAITSAFLLDRLVRHDRFVIEGLLNKATELQHGKRNIERSQAQLMARAEELNTRRREYSSAIDQTIAQLSGVQRQRQGAEAAVREMGQAQLEIERTLANLIRNRRELQRDAPPTTQEYQTSPAPAPTPTLGQEMLLDWPVRGAIASHFGPRAHPVYNTETFRSGIDISAPPGTTVRAAGPGVVLYEGWLQGFGQVVIIDHGRNLSTIYAHLATTRVRERETIMPGAVIGTTGNTGTVEGLHFEVRVGDTAKNPLDYLRNI